MPVYWLFPLLLLALAVGLVGWNVRAWRAVQRGESDADELAFGRRQFRRRVQASGMLAALAMALMIGQSIPPLRQPTLYVLFWCGVLLLLAWVVLLAMGDLVVNRQRLAKFQQQRKVDEARLRAELERIRSQMADHDEVDPQQS